MKKLTIIVITILLFVSFSFAGMEWLTTTTSEGKKKRQDNLMVSHVYAQAGNLKQVFEQVKRENDMYMNKGYWLFKAGDDNIYIVNDEKKTYTALNLDALLQLTGMFGQLVKIQILDHTIDSQALPKENVAGYTCNHIMLTTDYTMKIKIAFIKKTVIIHEEKEIWAAPNFKGLKEVNQTFMNKDLKTGFPDLDEMIKKQMEQQGKIGFPLKTVTLTVQKNKKGKVKSETTTTMEVSKIKSGNFPKSFFEIPGDYQQEEGPAKKKLGIF